MELLLFVNKNGIGALALLKKAWLRSLAIWKGMVPQHGRHISGVPSPTRGHFVRGTSGRGDIMRSRRIAKERALGWDEAAAGRSLFAIIEKMTAAGAQ